MPQLYESLFILRPRLPMKTSQDAGQGESHGGKGRWDRRAPVQLGQAELAYEIKQEKKGIYVQLNYRGNGPLSPKWNVCSGWTTPRSSISP